MFKTELEMNHGTLYKYYFKNLKEHFRTILLNLIQLIDEKHRLLNLSSNLFYLSDVLLGVREDVVSAAAKWFEASLMKFEGLHD